MENNEINSSMLRDMFNAIRQEEIKNIKVNKFDDKTMVKRISSYIEKNINKEGGMSNEI
jgi:hypothetical protein